MTTYDAKGMPQFATSDKIAAPGDGLREDLNLISASATAAIGAEGARAEQSAKDDATTKYGGLPSRMNAVESKNVAQDNTLSNYGPRITATESKNTAQDSTLSNHETRVKSLETLGGLAAGSVSDATVTDLVANAGTTTAGQLGVFVADKSAVVVAPKPSGGDDTAALNALLSANAGKVVSLRSGATYKINDRVSIPSGTTVEGNGATIDASGLPTETAFGQIIALASEGTVGDAVAVANPVTQWSKTVTGIASTSGFAPGDLVHLYNQEPPVPGMTRTDRDKGELRTVLTVDSATQITFVSGAVFAYGATGIEIRKVNPVENVTLRGFKLKLGGIGKAHNGIRFTYARNVVVENVGIDGAEDISLALYTVATGRVEGCSIRNSTNPSFTTSGYGVNVSDASQHIQVAGNNFYNCRHFVAGGGKWPAIYVDIMNNHGEKSLNGAYDCHETAFYWTFRGNTGANLYGGLLIRGQYITAENNLMMDVSGNAYEVVTVDGVTEQRGIRIINNRAVRALNYGVKADGRAAGAEPDSIKIDIEIRGNTLRDCGPDAILVRHFDGAAVTGNNISTPSRHGILALGTAVGTPSKRLTIDNNQITSPGGDGVQAQFVDDINGSGGTVTSPAQYGYEFITCNRTKLTGPAVRNPAFSGIYLNGGAVHTVSNGTVTGGTSASYDALRGAGASDITVTGGYYAGPRTGVATTGGDRVIITGVNASGSVSATKISSDATNKVVANNL